MRIVSEGEEDAAYMMAVLFFVVFPLCVIAITADIPCNADTVKKNSNVVCEQQQSECDNKPSEQPY